MKCPGQALDNVYPIDCYINFHHVGFCCAGRTFQAEIQASVLWLGLNEPKESSSSSTETEISAMNLKLTLFFMAGNPALAPVREVCCAGCERRPGFGVGLAPGTEEKAEVSN